jgi:hypothetical protein
MKVVRLSVLGTGRLYPRKYSWYSFLLEAELPQDHSVAGRIVNEKFQCHHRESNPRPSALSAVPQLTAPPRASSLSDTK